MKWIRGALLLPVVVVATLGCAALQQYTALTQVSFSLDRVGDGRLAGVSLARIAQYRDLSAGEIATLVATLSRGTAPFAFTINVGAANPASNTTSARLLRFDWLLLLDGKETIRGAVDTAYVIPAGDTVTIPVRAQLDLRRFFTGNVEEIVNLAAGFAGLRHDPTRITLELKPQVETPLGALTPPTPIRISGTTR